MSSIPPISIHLLHIKEADIKMPNLYLNLARVFSTSTWALLAPGGLPREAQNLTTKNSPINLEAKTGTYVLSSGSHAYPFPDLSPLLLRKDNNFWCTERFLAGGSRSQDWNECLWQVHLEMTGKVAVANAFGNFGEQTVENKQDRQDVGLFIQVAYSETDESKGYD